MSSLSDHHRIVKERIVNRLASSPLTSVLDELKVTPHQFTEYYTADPMFAASCESLILSGMQYQQAALHALAIAALKRILENPVEIKQETTVITKTDYNGEPIQETIQKVTRNPVALAPYIKIALQGFNTPTPIAFADAPPALEEGKVSVAERIRQALKE